MKYVDVTLDVEDGYRIAPTPPHWSKKDATFTLQTTLPSEKYPGTTARITEFELDDLSNLPEVKRHLLNLSSKLRGCTKFRLSVLNDYVVSRDRQNMASERYNTHVLTSSVVIFYFHNDKD